MIEDTPQGDPARDWWHGLTDAERQDWGDRAGRTFEVGGKTYLRQERDIAHAAYVLHQEETGRKILQAPQKGRRPPRQKQAV